MMSVKQILLESYSTPAPTCNTAPAALDSEPRSAQVISWQMRPSRKRFAL